MIGKKTECIFMDKEAGNEGSESEKDRGKTFPMQYLI